MSSFIFDFVSILWLIIAQICFTQLLVSISCFTTTYTLLWLEKKKILSTAVFCSSRYYCVVPLFNPHYTMSINNHSTIQSINVRLTRYLNSLQKILSSTRQLLNFSNLISESNLASSDKILKIKQENTFRIFIYLSKILCWQFLLPRLYNNLWI